MNKEKTSIVSTRVSESLKQRFLKKVKKLGGSSFVLREMLSAYVEGRLSIKRPKCELYEGETK